MSKGPPKLRTDISKGPPILPTGAGGQQGSVSGDALLISGAFRGDLDDVRRALSQGADINAIDADTGLAALHIAVGSNDLDLCRFLIEQAGADFFPDNRGRWPTLIAAQCRVDDELADYVVHNEAAATTA